MSKSDSRGCLGFLFGSREPIRQATVNVELKRKFLSDAEVNFFQILRSVVRDRGHIFVQVPLGHLLFAAGEDKSANWSKRNTYKQKTIDFLICDARTLRPLVAIELDDSSHGRAKRQTRDDMVHGLLESAGLPFYGVVTSRAYDTRELEAVIGPHLADAVTHRS